MTIYLTQGRFTDHAIKGMIGQPEDRSEAVGELVEALGATLVDYYFTTGEYDFLIVTEAEDDKPVTNAMAASLVSRATGGIQDIKITVGVRSSDAVNAMKMSGQVMTGFKPAGQTD